MSKPVFSWGTASTAKSPPTSIECRIRRCEIIVFAPRRIRESCLLEGPLPEPCCRVLFRGQGEIGALPFWQLITELFGNLQTGLADERGDLPQARGRHADRGAGNTQAGVDDS